MKTHRLNTQTNAEGEQAVARYLAELRHVAKTEQRVGGPGALLLNPDGSTSVIECHFTGAGAGATATQPPPPTRTRPRPFYT